MVPEHIRAVSRPINTVVVDSHTKGSKRYLVRERSGYKKSKGKFSGPRNGKVIGYIINGAFVPKDESTKRATKNPRLVLQYGPASLIYKECKDIHLDLLSCFDLEDANRIMTIASLRVIDPGIACNRYSKKASGSFLSQYYPCIGLSKNSISNFIFKLGMSTNSFKKFYNLRFQDVASSQNVFIDGVLKQDTGNNDLSRDYAKTHLKGHKEISVIYAYSHDMQEVLCSKVYQGNMLDSKAFHDFIESNNITKGIIVCDKGFPVSKVRDLMDKYKDLHYISPYRRNSKIIDELDMITYDSCATLANGVNVLCKKAKLENGKFLYSIRDMLRAYVEQQGLIQKGLKNNGTFDGDEYSKKILKLGMIVFESDLDLNPVDILNHYENKWWLELIFDNYKNTLDLDVTRVQERESVIGNEFINFIATLITCKLRKAIRKLDELYGNDGSTFTSRMSELRDVYRDVKAPINASINDGYWVLVASNSSFELMARLGLVDDPTGELTKLPTSRGKNTISNSKLNNDKQEVNTDKNSKLSLDQSSCVKKAGRPKGSLNKKTLEAIEQAKASEELPKRGRGRPKGSLNKKTLDAMKNYNNKNL